jgi:hypothetical protein
VLLIGSAALTAGLLDCSAPADTRRKDIRQRKEGKDNTDGKDAGQCRKHNVKWCIAETRNWDNSCRQNPRINIPRGSLFSLSSQIASLREWQRQRRPVAKPA